MRIFLKFATAFIFFHGVLAASVKNKSWKDCETEWPRCKDRDDAMNIVCASLTCGPRGLKNCIEIKPGPLLRQWMIDFHNEMRQKIASGSETRGGCEKSSNMRAISYDLGLEYTAICHANMCKMEHDPCHATRNHTKVGQNLSKRVFKKQVPDAPLSKEVTDRLATMWYEEIKLENFKEKIDKFVMFHDTGHFTQLIWALTTHIGCSRSMWNESADTFQVLLTCNYAPAGNVQGAAMYLKGEPCSKCPAGTKCNSQYNALCGDIDVSDIQRENPYRKAKAGRNDIKFSAICFFLTVNLLNAIH